MSTPHGDVGSRGPRGLLLPDDVIEPLNPAGLLPNAAGLVPEAVNSRGLVVPSPLGERGEITVPVGCSAPSNFFNQ